MSKCIKCELCGGDMIADNSIILTSYPPKKIYRCEKCGHIQYLETITMQDLGNWAKCPDCEQKDQQIEELKRENEKLQKENEYLSNNQYPRERDKRERQTLLEQLAFYQKYANDLKANQNTKAIEYLEKAREKIYYNRKIWCDENQMYTNKEKETPDYILGSNFESAFNIVLGDLDQLIAELKENGNE